MKLNVNGQTYNVPATPDRLLLWVLRDELGLTGTKFGCGAGLCGSCTVHLNGVATRACITPLSTIGDKLIRTIEGLAEPQADGTVTLHPVQQAWLDEQVPQCGWCQSGQMMTAAAFLATTPHPTEEQVVDAMSQNYCRCGCYGRIKRAILKAAEHSVAQVQ
jgi:isoquinoline 1-oxidoreductase alpha subunit